ncbi:MAG: hypothetical protein SFU98_13450 [Leptospiraceae bacterium]|nr:hypothetical protein [Leptospiraceae bacterium]
MKIIYLFLFFFSVGVLAQVNSPPYAPPGALTKPNLDTFSYDIGVNRYDKDYYLYFAPSFNMNFSNKWGFSLQVPLNILAYDNDPKLPNSKAGMLRPGDYNSRADYQRILNYIWVGNYGVYEPRKVTYSLYAGKMFDGQIGHGTIVNRYVNNQRVDYYKIGVQADINTDYGGVQVFTNSVHDKEVNAGRVYIRPFGIGYGLYELIRGRNATVTMMTGNVIDEAGRKKVIEEVDKEETREEKYVVVERDPKTGEMVEKEKTVPVKDQKAKKDRDDSPNKDLMDSIWNRFAVGYTSAYDGRAPNALEFDTTGNLKFDENNMPKVKRDKRLSIEGYDVEFKPISKSWIELTTYYDYNRIRHLDNSRGRHTGVILKLGSRDYNITIRPEFRRMSANYIPIYFDSFYEIERYQANLDSSFPQTKYERLEALPSSNAKEVSGYYHTVIVMLKRIGFEGNYEDYAGKDNSRVFVGAYVPIGQMFRLSAFYTKKGFDKSSEAFKVDDRAQGAGELAINFGSMTLKFQNRRRWVLDPELNQFKAKDEQLFLVSGGTSF